MIYKQILQPDEVEELNSLYINQCHSGISNLVTGQREYCDINLSEHMITKRLNTVLNDYFPGYLLDMYRRYAFGRYGRFYSHLYGSVKPHTDVNHDNKSNYTILIYLTDDFVGGQLSIKTKRPDEERLLSEPDKYHKVFTITPKIGYGVIFKKDLIHYAQECFGSKNFLLIHMYYND